MSAKIIIEHVPNTTLEQPIWRKRESPAWASVLELHGSETLPPKVRYSFLDVRHPPTHGQDMRAKTIII